MEEKTSMNSELFTKFESLKQMPKEQKISTHVAHPRMESMFSEMISKVEIITIIKIKSILCQGVQFKLKWVTMEEQQLGYLQQNYYWLYFYQFRFEKVKDESNRWCYYYYEHNYPLCCCHY